jgi:transcriptional regulator GlxA family with amidase domain
MGRLLFIVWLICSAISCTQCGGPAKHQIDTGPAILPGKELSAAFVVTDGAYDFECMVTRDIFKLATRYGVEGTRTFTIAANRDTITTFEGRRITPDYSFTTDSLLEIDILVVPGSNHSMDSDLDDQRLVDFVAKAGRHAAFVLSFREGSFVLARAGLLDLHECTTFPADIEKMREAFPQLKVHENVSFVKDRHMITSAGASRSFEAALYLTQLLYGKDVAKRIADSLAIEWNISHVQAVVTNR